MTDKLVANVKLGVVIGTASGGQEVRQGIGFKIRVM